MAINQFMTYLVYNGKGRILIWDCLKQGDDLVNAGFLEAGKQKYVAATHLLPDNQREWEAATWLFVAIGDVHFRKELEDLGRIDAGRERFRICEGLCC